MEASCSKTSTYQLQWGSEIEIFLRLIFESNQLFWIRVGLATCEVVADSETWKHIHKVGDGSKWLQELCLSRKGQRSRNSFETNF